MNRQILALTLALSVVPVVALAQDTSAPAAPTADQRQAMHQTYQRFIQQEDQLHQQMRWQILSALSPVHRRAVGATIGDLAIAQSPDIPGAAKRLDEMLSAAERQRIVAAHASFAPRAVSCTSRCGPSCRAKCRRIIRSSWAMGRKTARSPHTLSSTPERFC